MCRWVSTTRGFCLLKYCRSRSANMAAPIPMRCARRRSRSTSRSVAPCRATGSNSHRPRMSWPGRIFGPCPSSCKIAARTSPWSGRARSAPPSRSCRCLPLPLTRWVEVLEVAGLTKRFGGFIAVNSVDFAVQQGEILGLIGPNGSGKTTTFNLVAGSLPPSAGSIRFEGREIAGLPAHRVCRLGLARTFQIPRPFRKLSLRENVALPAYYAQSGHIARAEAERRAVRALDLVGLPAEEGATTQGLGAAAIKKLELARALATEPRLLLADESL